MIPPSPLFEFIDNPAVVLRAGDAVARIETCQNKLDARGADRQAIRGVNLKGFFPRPGHAFEPFGVDGGWQQITNLNLYALAENVNNFFETMLIDVLLEDGLNSLGLDRFEHLLFGHLMAAHHVQLQLA